MKATNYVALGSSFAAGPGIDPIIDKNARRSRNNYAHLLAAKLDAHLTDVTVSGATLLNVLNIPQAAVMSSVQFPAQSDQISSSTNIVTLTAGGNDMSYSLDMLKESAENTTLGSIGLSMFGMFTAVKEFFGSPTQPIHRATTAEVTSRFVEIIDKIHEKAPDAKIFLVEYLEVFTDDSKPGNGVPLTQAQIEKSRATSAGLAEAYRATKTARPEITLIPTAEVSKTHGLGSQEPWVTPFDFGFLSGKSMPYHPNKRGMEAVAKLIYEAIQASQTS